MTTANDTNAAAEVYCPDCGYDLRGRVAGQSRCPECGLEVDERALNEPRIPWVHRRSIGKWRAYWRTVRMVMLHSGQVGREVSRPVDFEEARRFQRVTVRWLSAVGIGVIVRWYVWTLMAHDVNTKDALHWVGLGFEGVGVVLACWSTYLFFLAVTGVGSYFFHPSYLSVEQQNRAVAVSYYGCAGLAWLPVLASASAGVIWWMSEGGERAVAREPLLMAAVMAAILSPVGLFVWVGWQWVAMMRGATRCGMWRAWLMGFSLPWIWGVLAVVVLAGIPAAWMYLGAIVMSLIV